MKHHVCAWYVRTLLYVHVCTDIAQYITMGVLTSMVCHWEYGELYADNLCSCIMCHESHASLRVAEGVE